MKISEKALMAIVIGVFVLLLLVLATGVTLLWRATQARNAKVNEINRLQQVFKEQKWQEMADGLEALFQKYPDTVAGYGDQASQSQQFLALEQYKKVFLLKDAERVQAVGPVIELLEKARKYKQYFPLSENSLAALCNCYMDRKEYDKAMAVIEEVEGREDVNKARFHMHKSLIERKRQMTKKGAGGEPAPAPAPAPAPEATPAPAPESAPVPAPAPAP